MRTRRTLLAPIVLLLLAAGSARGDEGPAWTRHVLGEGPASIALPAGWRVTRDGQGTWLHACDPESPGFAFFWTRRPLANGEDLAAFAARHLEEERGATIQHVGFRVDDQKERDLAGLPALWTLVAKPAATPPVRTLYVHLPANGVGYALAVHVPLGTFQERRECVLALLDTFLPGGEEETAALARALERLAASPPATVDEYREWMKDLAALGEAGRPHRTRLVETYVAGPGAEDEAARHFLGHRLFAHEIPDDVTFRDHPFLRLVERANEHRWFLPPQAGAYRAAEAAWDETLAHAETLRSDPQARTAEQTFANLAFDPTYAGLHLTFHSAPPYVLAYVSRDRLLAGTARRHAAVTELLARLGHDLSNVYRYVLARYGERHGLRDLAAPWGGGTEERPFRSFHDGVPLIVLVTEEERFLTPPGRRFPGGSLDARTGTLHLGDEDLQAVATAASKQLLWWFARQQRRWRNPPIANQTVADTLAAWMGAVDRNEAGAIVHADVRTRLFHEMRTLASVLAEARRDYPVFPLERLLGGNPWAGPVAWGQATFGLTMPVLRALYRQQAWALACFLETYEDGRHRDLLDHLLGAVLEGHAGDGGALRLVEQAFRVDDVHAPDLAEIDVMFGLWIHEHILAEDAEESEHAPAAPADD